MSATNDFQKLLDYRLIIGQIDLVDEDNGTVVISYVSTEGQRTMNMPAPFFANNSWIRGYPSEGSMVLLGITQNNQYPEILKVFDASEKVRMLLNDVSEINGDIETTTSTQVKAFDRVRTAKAPPGGLPFRKLRKGELEAMSSGKAFWWMSRYGDLTLKGGISYIQLDSENSLISSSSAGHACWGLDSKLTSLEDQHYFGVVRRPVNPKAFAAQKLLNAQLISNEIVANLESNEDFKKKVEDRQKELDKEQAEFEKAFRSMVSAINQVKGKLSGIESYNDLPGTLLEPVSKTMTTARTYAKDARILRALVAAKGVDTTKFDVSLNNFELTTSSLETSSEAFKTNSEEEVDAAMKKILSLKIPKLESLAASEAIDKANQKLEQKKQAVVKTVADIIKEASFEGQTTQVDSKFIYPSLLLEQGQFCKELRTAVSWKGSPGTLYEEVYGHVYNIDGVRETDPTTGNKLRSRNTWSCDDGSTTVLFVDVNGNVTHILSPSATRGYTLTVPKGHGQINIGKNLEVEVGKNCKVHVNDNLTVVADKIIDIKGEQINIESRTLLSLKGLIVKIEGTTLIEETAPLVKRTGIATIMDITPSYIRS